LERKKGDRNCTHLFLYKGHGKMARLTAKLFHQCPKFCAKKGKVFVAGGSCHMVIPTDIRVIIMGKSQQGECKNILWREIITLRAMHGTWDISP